METTYKIDCEDEYLEDVQNGEYQEMVEKADRIVSGFTALAGATCVIPIPFADAPLLVSQQVAMMIAINSVFGVKAERHTLTSLVTAAIGVGGATIAGKTVASNLFKLFPGVGTVAGGVISAGTAGIITAALGKAYIEVCREIKMGKLNPDDLNKKREMLKKSFKAHMKEKET